MATSNYDPDHDDEPPPHPPPLNRSFGGRILNSKQDIEHINSNRGVRLMLMVNDNMYTTWYYYQDHDGKFYYIIVSNYGNGPIETFQELDGPIDVNSLVNNA
jgi:hypothetical protein